MKKEIREILIEALGKAGYSIPVGFDISEPPKPEMGDYASNIALLAAKLEGKSPTEVADDIIKNIESFLIKEAKVAGPGFVNLYLNQNYLYESLGKILKLGDKYGSADIERDKSVNVEYISANPTGPVHVGNARGGPIGEAIANLYAFCGYKVTRSFYVNDIGGQIDKLAESFYYWYEKLSGQDIVFPEGGYPGEYVKDITEKVVSKYKSELESLKDKEEFIVFFKDKGVKAMVERIKDEVDLIGIQYDDWIYQSDLENSGKTGEVLKLLEAKGSIVEREGASWFRNPEDPNFQDDEAVLRKSDSAKTLTYFADDIACHKYKTDQGAYLMIDIWGSNHHGHIPRMKASMSALGISPERLQVILYQNVRIKNGEDIIKMSKREGNFVLLADVIKHGIGADVFKYFILNQNNNTPMDFDAKLAMDKSEKNPVFYVQYAYARISSIIKKSRTKSNDLNNADLSLLTHSREQALIKELVKFPDLVEEALLDQQMQVFPHYAHKLASMFHEFYNDCRVIGEDKKLEKARMGLVIATKTVLKNVLDICDITAPEKM